MNREFDIESIGKKMPYTPPSEEFFDNFKDRVMERVSNNEPQRKVGRLSRVWAPIIAVAASLVIGVFVADMVSHEPQSQFVAESLEVSIDSYFDSLSDDELAELIASNASQDSFYLTLPTNE